ncbi:MAG: methyltransferase domain-containing protein [Dermatophilaceae bacterium]
MTYTHGYASSVTTNHATRTVSDSAAYLLPHLGPGLRVLDVGCGPGSITLDLAEAVGPTGQVVGIDVSEQVLDLARRAAAARADTRTRWIRGDVGHLPVEPDSADVVHAHQVLQHLTDPVGAIREMARVARPGGLLALREVDMAATTWWPASAGLSAWLEGYRTIAMGNGTTPDAGRRLLAWAHAAGLCDVEVSGSTWTYADPARRRWLATSWAERTRRTLLPQAERHGVDAGELEDAALAWRSWGEEPDGWFAFVHTEVLARVT